MNTVIQVQPQHIKHGRAGWCNACPVALAIMPHIRIDASPAVGLSFIIIKTPTGLEGRALIPLEAQTWIRDFDSMKPVKPFSFTLDIPNELLRSRPV